MLQINLLQTDEILGISVKALELSLSVMNMNSIHHSRQEVNCLST